MTKVWETLLEVCYVETVSAAGTKAVEKISVPCRHHVSLL